MKYDDAVWQVLSGQRGRMLCTLCIGKAVQAVTRIDKALMTAEGRGAIRRYAPCATCGKDRLLCGLGHAASPAISSRDHASPR